jgi:thiol-disulfide isomerase/thioredoxin
MRLRLPISLAVVVLCLSQAALATPERRDGAVGAAMPELCFEDQRGQRVCLSQWRGRVVLLNLWATWCAPCRHEMPQLDRMQAALGGKPFEVVALSVDKRGAPAVANFYERIGVRNLALYVDPTVEATDRVSARGIPVTLLIDRRGVVVQRLSGPVDWEAYDKVTAIRKLIAE